MKLFVLMGQRKERYPGEYGMEALACMSEYDNDGNPDYLPEEKEKNDASGEFERTEVITFEVDEASIMKLLRPGTVVLPATVVEQ